MESTGILRIKKLKSFKEINSVFYLMKGYLNVYKEVSLYNIARRWRLENIANANTIYNILIF